MDNLVYSSITNDNKEKFLNLMIEYAKELDENQNRNTPNEILIKWTNSIIEKQNSSFRCLRLVYKDFELIGFIFGKIDQENDKGYKKLGYGYVMEFFVLPKYRRNGYGRLMYQYLEDYFCNNGVANVYLTADPITGEPFWKAIGFTFNGEISEENNLKIYEKKIKNGFIKP